MVVFLSSVEYKIQVFLFLFEISNHRYSYTAPPICTLYHTVHHMSTVYFLAMNTSNPLPIINSREAFIKRKPLGYVIYMSIARKIGI
jgi:hypothetical protein